MIFSSANLSMSPNAPDGMAVDVEDAEDPAVAGAEGHDDFGAVARVAGDVTVAEVLDVVDDEGLPGERRRTARAVEADRRTGGLVAGGGRASSPLHPGNKTRPRRQGGAPRIRARFRRRCISCDRRDSRLPGSPLSMATATRV